MNTFTMDDLMALLTLKTGLPVAAQTPDETKTFEDIGLDSLAFLAMQTKLQRRFGVEMPDDNHYLHTFGDIVETVQAKLALSAVA